MASEKTCCDYSPRPRPNAMPYVPPWKPLRPEQSPKAQGVQ